MMHTPNIQLRRYSMALSAMLGMCVIMAMMGCEPAAEGPLKRIGNTKVGVIAAQSKTLPKAPKRIISMAPNVTEVLFSVGAQDRLVGVTRFCDFPPKALDIAKIGGVVDPDFEAIIGLKPDLVIGVTSAGDPKILKSFDDAKIPYVFFKMETLAETYSGIEGIAQAAGEAKKGALLAEDMKVGIESFEASAAKPPSVLLLFGRKPLIAAGPNTFADDLIIRAGGRNAITGNAQYPKLDIEKVLELNPDRIIDLAMVEEGGDVFWQSYTSLEAVKHGNVYRLTDPALMRPGPRLVSSFQTLAMAIQGKHGSH